MRLQTGTYSSDNEAAVLGWLLQHAPDAVRDTALWRRPLVYLGETEQQVSPDMLAARTQIFTTNQLNEFRRIHFALNPTQFMLRWLLLRALQKDLYRERLLQRVGQAASGSTAPAFVFNSTDWQNIFQLEALVEFYMNFTDPWLPAPPAVVGANVPRLPTATGYANVNLLTGWHLVMVDSFGGRINGAAATAAGSVVTLDGPPDLAKVNANFDTIYLPNDTARPSKTYRITAVNNTRHTVTVAGSPAFSGGSSRWHIPAGVSGQLPPMTYDLGPGGARGYDHFDGVLFLVKDGAVQSQHRWNSYTSRNYDSGNQFLSSLRGNKGYDVSSFRSANAFRNYSFKVNDAGASYDGVREARFYFSTPVTPDNATPGSDPNGGGKTLIRIHHSQTSRPQGGCSSAGCIVSGNFSRLRDRMIELYQADYMTSHSGSRDAAIDRLLGAGHDASQTIWKRTQGQDSSAGPTVTAAEWNGRISGSFWLVRPDERPLG